MSSGPRRERMRSPFHGVSRSLVMSSRVLQHAPSLKTSHGPTRGSRRLGYQPVLPLFWNVIEPPFEAASSSPALKVAASEVAVGVTRARGEAVGVAAAVTVRLSTLGPLGSSVARMRTAPAGRLTLCVRTVQLVHPEIGRASG